MRCTSSDALETARRRVEQEPDDVGARVALVAALTSFAVERGLPLTASEFAPHFLFFIDRAPQTPAATSIGVVHPLDSWHPQLAQAWEEAIRKHADQSDVLLNAAMFFWGNDDARVAGLLKLAQAAAPDDDRVRDHLGAFYLRGVDLGRSDSSVAAAAALLDPGVRFPRSIGLAAVARLLSGEQERAAELARRALEIGLPGARDDAHLGHTVLGLLVSRQERSAAIKQLEASACQPFGWHGPSLRLADRLLQEGEVEPVKHFLRSLRAVWAGGDGSCERWLRAIERGETPKLQNPGR